ncbi:DUF3397 domain-containing protein [Heyndrickxia sporothermodurans]|uniref:DUF3397 family protein n=4 Tax=Heyndrickxia sporothermodurans TaxID=46224 RepID=A0AB37HER3_9BACI|nr:DUF3397 family protein [Heyndrickxia sporothermodurans]MBL5767853.1 DUF3397 family protein [Heyndrickxia sporothermodurans]MBL5771436.1 DUF3397 family protein [Heyndrickxia sporothermodurans]MBL5775112.1 DUF3397 family protein [Heyndrickxia sporothermodurans]MBL5778541.1 DUF3397 family protein [Heyndrickxia sporothermodurans]MBL5782129.1 DUF3397 family protein [Heyndrickxia sporothermodurans]
MSTFISWMIAILIIIPFIGYFLSFVLVKQTTKNHRKAVTISIDITTLILIISVHFFIKTIWGQSFLWLIVLVMLLLALLFAIVYRYFRDEIDYVRIFRGYWRLNFLLFFCIYIILLLYGLTSSVMESVIGS